jgi:hypothetical protein
MRRATSTAMGRRTLGEILAPVSFLKGHPLLESHPFDMTPPL